MDLARAVFAGGGTDAASAVATRVGRRFGVWTPSGRAGLVLALQALGVKRAIVPAFNCWAVMQSLEVAGIEPMFVDVGGDLNADPEQTHEQISRAAPDTAWILTHQFGVPMPASAELLSLARDRSVPVVEDAAAALGASTDAGPVGALGDVSVFSFQYTKSVFAGDGGVVVADTSLERSIRERASGFRRRGTRSSAGQWLKLAGIASGTHPTVYGWSLYRALPAEGTRNERDVPPDPSLFSDLPSPWMRRLAALTMARLDQIVRARREMASYYLKELADQPVRLVSETAAPGAAPIRFPVLVDDRAAFIDACAKRGLDLGRSFAYSCAEPGFHQADRVAASIVNLPLSNRLARHASRVVAIVREAALERGTSARPS